MQTPEGTIKMRQTMIEKHGSEENYRQAMRKQGAVGGKASGEGGFKAMAKTDPARLKEIASRGGTKKVLTKA